MNKIDEIWGEKGSVEFLFEIILHRFDVMISDRKKKHTRNGWKKWNQTQNECSFTLSISLTFFASIRSNAITMSSNNVSFSSDKGPPIWMWKFSFLNCINQTLFATSKFFFLKNEKRKEGVWANRLCQVLVYIYKVQKKISFEKTKQQQHWNNPTSSISLLFAIALIHSTSTFSRFFISANSEKKSANSATLYLPSMGEMASRGSRADMVEWNFK